MSKKKSAKAKRKNNQNAQKNPAHTKLIDSISQGNKTKPKTTGKIRRKTTIPRKRLKIENDFIKIAFSHPELQELKKALRYLGLSFEDFLDAIDLKTFLETGYINKGTINEILILRDRVMINLLKERADGSVFNLFFFNKQELSKAVGNVADKEFHIFAFEKLKTKLATNFKTLPDNKLYFDFSMVRFDEAAKSLFLVIPGEIKEPKAAAELAKQFGRFVRRLKETENISFQIGNQTKEVSSQNVFFVKDNAVGIARRKDQLANPQSGKTLSEKTSIMEIINAKFKDSRPEANVTKNKQEFIRFIVRMNPQISPQKIQDTLIEIKTKILKIPHK